MKIKFRSLPVRDIVIALCTGTVLALVVAPLGWLLLRQKINAGDIRTFTEQTAAISEGLEKQLVCGQARGMVTALGISNLRIQNLIRETSHPAEQHTLLESLLTIRDTLQADLVYIMDRAGTVLLSTPFGPQGETLDGNTYAFRNYFRRAIRGETNAEPALGFTTLERGIYHAAPVYIPADDSPAGVVVIKMPAEPLTQRIRAFSGVAAIISPQGIVFAASDPTWGLQRVMLPLPIRDPDPDENPELFTDYFKTRTGTLPLTINSRQAIWNHAPHRYAIEPISNTVLQPGWHLLVMHPLQAWHQNPLDLAFLTLLYASCLLLTFATRTYRQYHRESQAKRTALLEAAETYHAIFTQTSDAIFVHDPATGTILDANPHARRWFGYSRKDLARISYTQAFPYPVEAGKAAMQTASSDRHTFITFEACAKDGHHFWVEAVFHACRIQGRTCVLVVLHDITEKRKAYQLLRSAHDTLEAEVRKRTAQLLQSQKMAALGRLAEKVTHDFTNVIMRMNGYADLIRRQDHGSRIIQAALEEMAAATDEITKLTADLLAFAHPAPLSLAERRIARILRSSGMLIQSLAPKSVTVSLDIPDVPWIVRLSPPHLEQVLVNLAESRFGCLPNGATLRLALRLQTQADLPKNLKPDSQQSVLIEVFDDGPAIPPGDEEHMFDPFATQAEADGGRGIAMGISYMIVVQHSGCIRYKRGSDDEFNGFEIWLPLTTRAHDL